MKHWKRSALALLLALTLSLSALPGAALAAGTGTVSNFKPERTYAGQFADVPAGSWFYDNVAYLYEIGLTNGVGGGSAFGSDEEITLAEVITFAARVSCIYQYRNYDRLTAAQGAAWYASSVDYLKDLGLLNRDSAYDGRYDREASTRLFAGIILARILPEDEYQVLNPAVEEARKTGGYIPDLEGDGAEDILLLYQAGITNGIGDSASFQPGSSITRKEFAAMLTRLVDPSLRLTLDWAQEQDPEPDPEPTSASEPEPGTMASLLRDALPPDSPHNSLDEQAIKQVLAYMLRQDKLTVSLHVYNRLSQKELQDYMNAYADCMRKYFFEQSCSRSVQASAKIGSDYTDVSLTFGFYEGDSEAQNQQLRQDTMDRALEVQREMWASGTLTSDMNQAGIAKAYYKWIAENCEYDDNDSLMSHSALGVFDNGLAVCDGYTMAYNLLLELEGIDCDTAHTDTHIWTVATLDGKTVHIDTTWGDQGEQSVNYDYFGMTEYVATHRKGL